MRLVADVRLRDKPAPIEPSFASSSSGDSSIASSAARAGATGARRIDGPYSLFESVTKYGLQLALVLPALEACDELSLVAEIRWGKQREPLASRITQKPARVARRAPNRGASRRDSATTWPPSSPRSRGASTHRVARASESDAILDLPGIGVCIPDLVFERAGKKRRVYFEALGFWSRDAVWKR